MKRPIPPPLDLDRWTFPTGRVGFTLTGPSAWLAEQRVYLTEFLATDLVGPSLASFRIRLHADDAAFHTVAESITRSPATRYVEPVPGVTMQEHQQPSGRRCYAVAADAVENQPGAYAVAVHDNDIELYTYTGTIRPHRYPIRLIREAMMRTYEDAGGAIFHAAGVDVAGTGIMICGPRGAGKTTTVATLLRLPGAGLLSNDRLITYRADQLVAVPLPVPTARGTIQAYRELELAFQRTATHDSDLNRLPTAFGATVKHAFTARQFAEAFGADLLAGSTLRLVIVPRLTDTADPIQVRRLTDNEASQILRASCFTPRDEFWTRPWLVPRQRTDEQLSRQARGWVRYIAETIPCIEVGFGVRNSPIGLATALDGVVEQSAGDAR